MSASGENKSANPPQIENPPITEESKPTPAIVKNRRLRDHFQSPSDQLMSPFSAQLAGRQMQFIRHPAIMKQKPKKLVEAEAMLARKDQQQAPVEPLAENNQDSVE